MEKKCTKCGLSKNLTQFYKDRGRSDGRHAACKQCEYKKIPHYRRPPQESAFNKLFGSYRNSAKFRGLSFTISYEFFREVVQQPCFHCGDPPSPYNPFKNNTSISKKRREDAWILKSGIDRVDNSIGYEANNCVPCCAPCNYMRQDSSILEWLSRCRKILDSSEARNVRAA